MDELLSDIECTISIFNPKLAIHFVATLREFKFDALDARIILCAKIVQIMNLKCANSNSARIILCANSNSARIILCANSNSLKVSFNH